jgi:hypothetical protein
VEEVFDEESGDGIKGEETAEDKFNIVYIV